MEKTIIPNRCDKGGFAYITFLDFLKTIAHYHENGKFSYIQSVNGYKYYLTDLVRSNFNLKFKLKLIDPDHQLDHGNLLAEERHTYKTAEVEILDQGISKCIDLQKLDDGFISIDTDTGHLSICDFRRLLQKNDTIKIKLTDGVKMDDEFAMLGGKVALWDIKIELT